MLKGTFVTLILTLIVTPFPYVNAGVSQSSLQKRSYHSNIYPESRVGALSITEATFTNQLANENNDLAHDWNFFFTLTQRETENENDRNNEQKQWSGESSIFPGVSHIVTGNFDTGKVQVNYKPNQETLVAKFLVGSIDVSKDFEFLVLSINEEEVFINGGFMYSGDIEE